MIHDTRLLVVIALALATAVVLVASSRKAGSADNDTPCLTREQAKAKYPGQWLYWHTVSRCWDNVSTKSRHSRSIAAAVRARPEAKHVAMKTVREDEFNELDAQADNGVFFTSTPMPLWPPLLPTPQEILQEHKFIPWDERIK